MRLPVLFAFLSWLNVSHAQSEDTSCVYIPGAFYDYEQEFLSWVREPTDFCAKLYDRWGNLLFESSEPKFGFDMLLRERKLMEAEGFWLILEFTLPNGEPITIRKQIIYAGSRCLRTPWKATTARLTAI